MQLDLNVTFHQQNLLAKFSDKSLSTRDTTEEEDEVNVDALSSTFVLSDGLGKIRKMKNAQVIRYYVSEEEKRISFNTDQFTSSLLSLANLR